MATTDPMAHIATAFQEVANLVRQGGGPEDLMSIVLTGDISHHATTPTVPPDMLMPEGAGDVYGDILNMDGDPFTAAEAATQQSIMDMMDDQQGKMLAVASGSEARTALAASSFEQAMQDLARSGVTIDDEELVNVLAGNFGIPESDLDQELKEHERRFADWESQAVPPTMVDPNISNVPLIIDEFGPSAQETIGALPPSVDQFTSALNVPVISDEDMFLALGGQDTTVDGGGPPLYELGQGKLPADLEGDYSFWDTDLTTGYQPPEIKVITAGLPGGEDDEKEVEKEVEKVEDQEVVTEVVNGESTRNEQVRAIFSDLYNMIRTDPGKRDYVVTELTTLLESPHFANSNYYFMIFPDGFIGDVKEISQQEANSIAAQWQWSLSENPEARARANYLRWDKVIDDYGALRDEPDEVLVEKKDAGAGTGVGLAELATELEASTDKESDYAKVLRGMFDSEPSGTGRLGFEYIGLSPDDPSIRLFVYRGPDGKSQDLYGWIDKEAIGEPHQVFAYGALEGTINPDPKGFSPLKLGGYTWVLYGDRDPASANRWVLEGQPATFPVGGMDVTGAGMPTTANLWHLSNAPGLQWDALRAAEMGEDIYNPIKWGARRFGYGEARGKYMLSGEMAGGFPEWLQTSGYQETPAEDIAQQWESLVRESTALGQPTGEGAWDPIGGTQAGYIRGDDPDAVKRNTIYMIMAALGAGEGMGSMAMARTLSDMYDVYATQQLAQMGQPGGFAGEFSKWLAPGAVPGSVPG